MFGGMVMDAAGLLRMRLSEHAVHSWDVEVAVDPAARVSQNAVELLLGALPQMMQWMGKKAADPAVIAVTATSPDGAYTLDTGGVTLTPGAGETAASASVELTSEALLRLVYGRVDESAVASGELRAENVTLPELQAVFPGFSALSLTFPLGASSPPTVRPSVPLSMLISAQVPGTGRVHGWRVRRMACPHRIGPTRWITSWWRCSKKRSLDNVLGHLYGPGDGKTFTGSSARA